MSRICDAIRDGVVVTVDDIECLGSVNMDGAARSYYNSGIDQEQTLKENRAAFLSFGTRPIQRQAATTANVLLIANRFAFGEEFTGISSRTSSHQTAHNLQSFYVALSAAARDAETLMVLSSFSNYCIEDVRGAAPEGLRWFQLHVFRDREFTRNLVGRAEKAGYRALVLTVDLPVNGGHEYNKKDFRTPSRLRLFGNFEGTSRHEDADPRVADYDNILDPSLTWRDVTWLKGITKLPVVAKGICTAEDAEEAIRHGVSAIWVSNHGARQLDGLPSTIEVLPEIVSAVRDRVEVYMDGGARHGTDVVKALALGAKAVFVGRPALWGLAYNVSQ
ncbi:unnamed protein product, partial [Ixodes hexagonus]